MNTEKVLGPTPTVESEYTTRWHNAVRATGVFNVEIFKAAKRMAA